MKITEKRKIYIYGPAESRETVLFNYKKFRALPNCDGETMFVINSAYMRLMRDKNIKIINHYSTKNSVVVHYDVIGGDARGIMEFKGIPVDRNSTYSDNETY